MRLGITPPRRGREGAKRVPLLVAHEHDCGPAAMFYTEIEHNTSSYRLRVEARVRFVGDAAREVRRVRRASQEEEEAPCIGEGRARKINNSRIGGGGVVTSTP